MAQATAENGNTEHVVRGMWAASGAFLMFTIMNVFAKYLSANHSVIEIAFYRNLFACVPFLIATFMFGRREILVIPEGRRGVLDPLDENAARKIRMLLRNKLNK